MNQGNLPHGGPNEGLAASIGRAEQVADAMPRSHAEALASLFDRGLVLAEERDLPALWHWVYFWNQHFISEVGPDGHDRRGGASLIPPIAAQRRMYAGGKVELLAPLTLGVPAQRHSSLADIVTKSGSAGPLTFVTLEHRIFQGEVLRRLETQRLVYLDVAPGATYHSEGVDADAAVGGRIEFQEALGGLTSNDYFRFGELQAFSPMLFRFSALSYNSHKIHYDRDYCRDEEGYPGLVVHGPLLALAALESVLPVAGASLASFEFRAMAPVFEGQVVQIAARQSAPEEIAIQIECGARQCMVATAKFHLPDED